MSLDKLSWDAYNEQAYLPTQIENYRERLGYYPKSVHTDTIYRTRENHLYCTALGIRLSGKPLGRPRKETSTHRAELKAQRSQQRQDELDRIPLEGKFGDSNRGGTLQRVMAKLSQTSESVIHVAILVLNLEKHLRVLLLHLIKSLGIAFMITPAETPKASTAPRPRFA